MKIKTIKWDEFFKVNKNKMITYRIIPHSKVNNHNKRLWKAIHKMYEMYNAPSTRFERKGLKFTFREKDYLWFDVIFKQVDGQKKIEFYVSTSEFQANKLKRKLENKMDITLIKSDLKALQVPKDNTIIHELKYLRHDIFSLNTNSSEQWTPIAGILNTVDELDQDGDFARLSIFNEVESRHKWHKNSSWAFEKFKKGKVPQRANITGRKMSNVFKKGVSTTINEVNDLITDIFQSIANVFLKSDKSFKKDKVIENFISLVDEINLNSLSHSTREKMSQGVFKTRIRVASHSNNRITRDTIQETITTAFSDLSENNELHSVRVRKRASKRILKELNTLVLSKQTKVDGNVNLMSCDEMNKIALQMPTAELQRRYDKELSIKRKIETDIPIVLQKEGIHIGYSEVKDRKIPIYITTNNPDEFYRSYVFIGSQGNGKDTAIINWVVDACLNHGISAIIPDVIDEDGHRGMSNAIRDALPPDKIIDIDLSNENYIVPMDLTEVITKLGRKGASRFADEIIDFLNINELTRSQKYAREAAKASGGSLYNMKRILEDEKYRNKRIEELRKEGNLRLANAIENWGTNKDLGSKIDPILHRLETFFGNDTLYDIFAQPPKKEVDFAKWMSEGKVVILRIQNRVFGTIATQTLVHWIILKAFMTRMLMTKKEQENGCFFVFNEPEQFETVGLTNLMGRIGTEGRKARLGALYAFHHWNKLNKPLQENLQGGGVNQFLFANDHLDTFEKSKHRLEPTIELEDAYRLPKWHSIVSVRAGGELQNSFVCAMKPPVKIQFDNSFLTKRHAQMYGRKWEELQKII